MKEERKDELSWVFFGGSAKPTFPQRALAERVGENEKVIIVDVAVSVHQERTIPALRARALTLQGNKNITQYRPLHFPEKLPGVGRILRALNQRLIQREIDHLLPIGSDRIVCFDSPTQYSLVKKFRERLSIYLAIDDRTLTVWGDPISGEAEAESMLLGKVDRVVCVSEALAAALKSRVPKGANPSIEVLPNAYDERIFDPYKDYKEPSALRNIPRPRILISGHISNRIDWDGIAAASRLRPKWTWVFLGPTDPGIREKIRGLLDSRAVLKSSIPVEEVPAWIDHCDACAVPYRLNLFTLASHPVKAIEYLVMGVPVLSTRIPSLRHYGNDIEWVDEGDGEAYGKVLDKFLNLGGNGQLKLIRRDAFAKESWEERASQFKKMVLSKVEASGNVV